MSTPIRVLGSDPLDVVRVTLSRQLRAVLYRAGIVDSPDLPIYDRPEHAPSVLIRQFDGPQPPEVLDMLAGAYGLDKEQRTA